MKHYTKFNVMAEPTDIPKAGVQVVDARCYYCGKVTRMPVPNTYVDWEKIAEEYRHGYERLVGRVNQMIADIDVMHAGPNPVREYIANEWAVMLEDIRKRFENPPPQDDP